MTTRQRIGTALAQTVCLVGACTAALMLPPGMGRNLALIAAAFGAGWGVMAARWFR